MSMRLPIKSSGNEESFADVIVRFSQCQQLPGNSHFDEVEVFDSVASDQKNLQNSIEIASDRTAA